MFSIHSIIKRQIEILGLIISQQKIVGSFVTDLAVFFGVDDITIKRDLSDLRKIGINIGSKHKAGVCLKEDMDVNQIGTLITQYAGLNISRVPEIDKSTKLLVDQSGDKALSFITLLQICADRRKQADISYNDLGERISYRTVCPIYVLQHNGYWRLIAQEQGRIKQFFIEKIRNVRITKENFQLEKPVTKSSLFNYSWGSWIGTSSQKFPVKLHICSEHAEEIKSRRHIQSQKITEQEDGSLIFEANVNSLYEIGSWIMGWGAGIKVLEPEALKEYVIFHAKGVLSNYEN